MVGVESDISGPLDRGREVRGYDGDIGGGGIAASGSPGVRLRVEDAERVGSQSVDDSLPPGCRPVAGGMREPGGMVCVPVTQDEDIIL